MESIQPVLDGLAWFFGLPAVNQVLGAFLAGSFGLGAFYVQTSHRERAERTRVARALLQEMLQVSTLLLESHATLNQARHDKSGLLGPDIMRSLPNDRKIYSMIGGEIGVLSDQAIAHVVAFDGTVQALERDFTKITDTLEEYDHLNFEECGRLADKVSDVLDHHSVYISSLVGDAYARDIQMPESTRKMIKRVQSS